MDTWISLRNIEVDGERNRGLYVLKSRGMSHSNQIREFELSKNGGALSDAYLGPSGIFTGSARLAQEALDSAEEIRRAQEANRKRREMQRRRAAVEPQIAELQASLEAQEDEINEWLDQDAQRERGLASTRDALAARRGAAE